MKSFALGLSAIVAFASCGGGNAQILSTTPRAGASQLQFTLTIPRIQTSAAKRKPLYVSASTQSVRIDVGTLAQPSSVGSTIANLASAASGCTQSATQLVCVLTVAASQGATTFTVTTFDAANASGNQLSAASIPIPVRTGDITSVNITLNGIISQLALAFIGSPPTNGRAGTSTLSVVARDADANIIVGPGSFFTPVTLTSDAPGAFSFSPVQISTPGQTSSVTYTGQILASAHFSASIPGGPSATLTAFGPTPTPPPAQHVYAAQGALNTIVAYTLPATMSSIPAFTFGVSSSPVGLAENASALAVTGNTGTIEVFAPPYSAVSTPTATFASGATTGGYAAFDPSGNLWIATQGSLALEFAPPFTAASLPIRSVSIGLTNSYGIAFDNAANLYITNASTGIIDMYAPPYSGAPIAVTFPPTAPTLSGIATFGSQVAVADSNGRIAIYTAPLNATSTPTALIPLAGNLRGLGFDGTGNLYVVDSRNNLIDIFSPPFSSASVPVFAVTLGPSGGTDGLVIGP